VFKPGDSHKAPAAPTIGALTTSPRKPESQYRSTKSEEHGQKCIAQEGENEELWEETNGQRGGSGYECLAMIFMQLLITTKP
jgi:hypothetical protein